MSPIPLLSTTPLNALSMESKYVANMHFLSLVTQPIHMLQEMILMGMFTPIGLFVIAFICLCTAIALKIRQRYNPNECDKQSRRKFVAPKSIVFSSDSLSTIGTNVTPCDSYEKVTLSFGTDRPEVYLKMAKEATPKNVMTSSVLHSLLVQRD